MEGASTKNARIRFIYPNAEGESDIIKRIQEKGGDVITAIDGIPVTKFEDLSSYVQEQKSVGDHISFTIYRNGQVLELQGVVLTFHPFEPMQS